MCDSCQGASVVHLTDTKKQLLLTDAATGEAKRGAAQQGVGQSVGARGGSGGRSENAQQSAMCQKQTTQAKQISE